FALGKAYEDRGDYDTAWQHYDLGNRQKRRNVAHDPVGLEMRHDEIRQVFSREFFEQHAGSGCEAADPIFIVGLPRSGSTLIEQILSSHSQVEGTAELPDIPALVNKLGPYPAAVLALGPTERKELGREYLKRAGVQRRTERPLFIDKLTKNWLYVPFIHLVPPRAKIIDARRHPLACCFSNFRQHFARGQPFTYDLRDIGHYYADYVRLMAHIDTVLPC